MTSNYLKKEIKDQIAKKLLIKIDDLSEYFQYFKLEKYTIGQNILNEDVKSNKIYILINGQVRVRAPLANHNSLSIEVVENNGFFGLLNEKLGEKIEFCTASSKVNIVSINCKEFKSIRENYDDLNNLIIKSFVRSDLCFLVNRYLKEFNVPEKPKEAKAYLNLLMKYKLEIDKLIINSKNDKLNNNYLWFKKDIFNTSSIDNPYTTSELLSSAKNLSDNLFIGFPISLLKDSQEHQLIKNNSDSKKVLPGKDVNLQAPYERNKNDIKEELIEKDNSKANTKDSKENDKKYKFISSQKGLAFEASACFSMLAKVLNLPLRRDVVLKILEEQSQSMGGEISLQLCAAIAESYGLQTQIIELPLSQMCRVQTPAFVQFEPQEMSIIFESLEDSIIVGRPLKEDVEKLEFSDLESLKNKKTNKFQCLTFKTTERTSQKRFGLNWFKPAIKKNKKQLIEVLIASTFVQMFQLMNPLIIQQIIDKVLGQNAAGTLPVLASLLVTFSVFENILTAVRTNLFIDTTNRIDISLGEQVIDHLLRLPLGYFDKRPVGELSSRIAELEQIREFLTGTALTVVLDAVFSIIYIAVMLIYSWILTIVALLVAPLLALITFTISPIIRRQLRTKAILNASTQNHLVEVLTGIQTVKAQNFELNARWKWKDRYSKYVSEGYRNAVTSTTSNAVFQFLNQSSSLIVLCVGAYLVLRGDLTLGQLIAFRIISGYVTGPLLRLSNLYQSFQQTTISLERLGDILNTEQESTVIDKDKIPMKQIEGKISIDNLSFSFQKKGPLQISQASLDIDAGQFCAIVGQSGSGKSTLTKLIPRLYEPNQGSISIDGYDISKVELYSLRRQIGMIPQDSLLFDGSIQENIALTNPEATSEQIIKAAKVACAHDFIMSLSSGYNSPVGERGSALSGGQRQRIAIARTVLQNPRLLIMDEATSALDYETERKVSLNIMEHFRGKTVIFITHRIKSITNADKIVLMHSGVIEEEGKHLDLMAQKGRYYALFTTQEDS